jgi:GntR family transcriptional regulator/MocR family aminotransferase
VGLVNPADQQPVPGPAAARQRIAVAGELPAGLKLIDTAPAHQYPLSGRLPVPRRRALTGWARANGALIAEDDYDGEFRYDVAALPALFGLDPEVVIYLGSTTKTLTPRCGSAGWQPGRNLSPSSPRRRPARRLGHRPRPAGRAHP